MTAYGLVKWGGVLSCLGGLALVALVRLWTGRIPAFCKLILIGVAACGLFYFYTHHFEPNWIKVEHVRIQDPVLASAAGDLRIVQITDIHLNKGRLGFLEKDLIRKVNALKPDLLFFTGDVVDDLTEIPAALELFRSFKVRMGIYAVPGDTDHIVMDASSLVRELGPGGIHWLINDAVPVPRADGRTFWIAGVDPLAWGKDPLAAALKKVPMGAPVILLGASPDLFESAAKAKVPLYLTGDTHGGQVGIDFLIRMSEYANRSPYMRGLFKMQSTRMYVNRGIGTKTLPIRFLCRPEIAVFELGN